METKLSRKFQYVWYGTCESERCDDVLFDNWHEMKDELEDAVVEISTYEEGEFKSSSPAVANSTTASASDKPNTLLGMRCGHMYLVTLKTNRSIKLPNTYASSPISKIYKYGASENCSTISDADLLGCGGQDYTTFNFNDSVQGNWNFPDDAAEDFTTSNKTAIYTNAAGEIYSEALGFNDRPPEDSPSGPYTLLTELVWFSSSMMDPNSYISIKLDDYDKDPSDDGSVVNVVNLTLNGRTVAWFTINGGILESTQIYYYENASCYRGKISTDDFVPDPENGFAGRVNVLLGTEQAIHTWPELCTFRDPREESDPDSAVKFISFMVSSSPSEQNTSRNDIEVGQFVWKGVLQLPPEQAATEDNTLTEPMTIVVKSESGDLLGSVKYLRRPPTVVNENVFVYFYAESGPHDGKCLFGVMNVDEIILKGVS